MTQKFDLVRALRLHVVRASYHNRRLRKEKCEIFYPHNVTFFNPLSHTVLDARDTHCEFSLGECSGVVLHLNSCPEHPQRSKNSRRTFSLLRRRQPIVLEWATSPSPIRCHTARNLPQGRSDVVMVA